MYFTENCFGSLADLVSTGSLHPLVKFAQRELINNCDYDEYFHGEEEGNDKTEWMTVHR